jgi:hypothetical protein
LHIVLLFVSGHDQLEAFQALWSQTELLQGGFGDAFFFIAGCRHISSRFGIGSKKQEVKSLNCLGPAQQVKEVIVWPNRNT